MPDSKHKINHNYYQPPSDYYPTSSEQLANKSHLIAIKLCDTCLPMSNQILSHVWLNLLFLLYLAKLLWLLVLLLNLICRLLCNCFNKLPHWVVGHGITLDLRCL